MTLLEFARHLLGEIFGEHEHVVGVCRACHEREEKASHALFAAQTQAETCVLCAMPLGIRDGVAYPAWVFR